ncbi:MAG: hypothetical protein D6775_00485 [Caldilineae bacterium]|nr:MAG: hypothetical protein D6775_00485 [Caldilineae bacterium]
MLLALLADIHGNLPALEAVMAELERLQPDEVVLDGDLINAAPFSGEVIDRVRATDWRVLRGNHEFYYLNYGTERDVPHSHDPERWGQLHWLVEHITPEQGRYLAALPDELTLYYPGTRPLRVAHGVPGNHRGGFWLNQPQEDILAAIAHVAETTLVTAHTHVQFDRILPLPTEFPAEQQANPHMYLEPERSPAPRYRHVVNPGSVGLPLNGDPTAQFAVLESVPDEAVPGGWKATHYRIPYDRRPVLEAFYTSGMLEAGGVISRLFYWEIVTAECEIIYFFHWARKRFEEPEANLNAAFAAYIEATGRDRYVNERDPLRKGARTLGEQPGSSAGAPAASP